MPLCQPEHPKPEHPKIEPPDRSHEPRGSGGSAPGVALRHTAKAAEGHRACIPCSEASGDGADPENLVEFFQGERVIARGYGAEDFRVEFDLVKRHAVVEAQIETLSHRAHLRC